MPEVIENGGVDRFAAPLAEDGFVTLNLRIQQKTDPAETWATNNPILLLGEFGIETDTGKMKFGDGVTAWNNLGYMNVPYEEFLEQVNLSKSKVFMATKSSISENDMDIINAAFGSTGEYADITPGEGDIFIVNSALGSSTLQNPYIYVTRSVDQAGWFALVDLSNYVTTDDFTSTLETYVKSEDLSNTLSEYTTSEQLTTALSSKQDTLVSGVNVKTINSQSILGEGDIQIEGETFPEGGTTGQFLQKTAEGTAWADIDLSGKADTNGTYPDMTVGNATNATTAQSATTAASATTAESATNATNAVNATTATNAGHATTADSATKATEDSEGNDIVATYATKKALEDLDTLPNGGMTGQFLQKTDDGSAWTDIDLSGKADTNGTYPNMTVGNATNATTAQSATTAASATTAETATNATHATNADRATSDVEGNAILSTYAKITALNETNATLQEIQEKANEADAIARGKATSYVFDTVAALDDWLETPENVAKLRVGDNFYIEDVGVPDYWWNGEARMVLESEKPDMSNYYSKDEVDTRLTQKANTDGTYSSMSVGSATSAETAENATHATTADSATKATQDGDGNVISTTYVKVNQITKQDIANALGCTTSQLDTIITLAQKITVSNSEIVSSVRVTAPEFNDN